MFPGVSEFSRGYDVSEWKPTDSHVFATDGSELSVSTSKSRDITDMHRLTFSLFRARWTEDLA